MPTHLFEGIVPDLIRDRDIAFSNLAARVPRKSRGRGNHRGLPIHS